MPIKKVVDPVHARTAEYLEVLKKIEKEGKCPFCPENFKYHPRPVLKKTKEWFITRNTWPYRNAKHHLLIIGIKHKEKLLQLSPDDWKEIHELTCWAIKKYKIRGGALTIRFGDTRYTGATVCHLHFHLISPKLDKKNRRSKAVNFPIG